MGLTTRVKCWNIDIGVQAVGRNGRSGIIILGPRDLRDLQYKTLEIDPALHRFSIRTPDHNKLDSTVRANEVYPKSRKQVRECNKQSHDGQQRKRGKSN